MNDSSVKDPISGKKVTLCDCCVEKGMRLVVSNPMQTLYRLVEVRQHFNMAKHNLIPYIVKEVSTTRWRSIRRRRYLNEMTAIKGVVRKTVSGLRWENLEGDKVAVKTRRNKKTKIATAIKKGVISEWAATAQPAVLPLVLSTLKAIKTLYQVPHRATYDRPQMPARYCNSGGWSSVIPEKVRFREESHLLVTNTELRDLYGYNSNIYTTVFEPNCTCKTCRAKFL